LSVTNTDPALSGKTLVIDARTADGRTVKLRFTAAPAK
jgi:hypothetical protein